MRILLQFPEGLKSKALEFAQKYETAGHNVYISCSQSFGGCDVAFEEAENVKADRIIHFGHSKFPLHKTFSNKFDIPVEYVEYHIDIAPDFIDMIVNETKKYKTVTLVTVVQHIHQFEKIKNLIESNNVRVVHAKGAKCAHRGQVLGCDPYAAVSPESDAVVFIGGGRFHYLALHNGLSGLGKPVIFADVYKRRITNVTDEIKRYIKKRTGIVAKASEAHVFGVLLSTRPGQFAPELSEQIRSKLRQKNKVAHILVSRMTDPEALQNFNVFDAYVNTGCPRIADDDERIGKPIVNADEFDLLLQMFSR